MEQSAQELIEEAISQSFQIMDGIECFMWCQLCGAQEEPTEGAVYDYSRVIHREGCIIGKMQAWLAEKEKGDTQ